jgi:UDP-3-O-[3-hydroxymyristoyl] N-acetylglucosamine deacetylase
MQNTINAPVSFDGVGLHSGHPAALTIRPASPGTGILFRRVDCGMGVADIPARWDHALQSALCTRLVNAHGVELSTVEHVMAALAGCGIHNALIEVNGPEVPIMDGSAWTFVRGILSRGVRASRAPVRALRVRKPVEVRRDQATARLLPHSSLMIEFSIDFADAAIGQQKKTLNMSNGSFVRELSTSRTFCRRADVEAMVANGLARGGSPGENAVVFDGDRVICPGGLRHADEPVRHKMLDALGDLGLAGGPLLGHYQGVRAGHALTNELLRALFADPDAHEWLTCDADIAARLPGAGLHPGEVPEVA